MKVGLVLPQGYFNEFEGWDPGRAWTRIGELALTAERLGFESIWTGEHVLSKWPGESIAFDCWALSSGLAPLVPRVGIGLIVMNSTFHNPAMTAKAASTLDSICGGRLTLGLGAGFKENEALAYGHPYPPLTERMEWLAEHFEIIWRMTRQDEPAFTFGGAHARVEDVANSPRSARSPGVRLLIGGHGKKYTFRLAARYCDELNLNVFPDEVPPLLDVFRDRCAEIGRDPATVELNCGTNQIMRYKGLRVTGGQRFAEPHELAYQDPDKVAAVGTRAEELAAWRELGFDRITAGIPGLHNTDEGLYEFIDDCRAAGIDFFDRQAPFDHQPAPAT
jgi:alkanesulfonate monooxygenase SsuD/methylene tetrahydromethanopterin reductase-like flavin-dependent oxidoreductase (luciferase family)